MAFIQVVKNEHSNDAMELPLENDNTLDMATLTSQYPNAIGLKYKAESGAWRGVKVNGSTISHPVGNWSESTKYVVTYNVDNVDNKRKATADDEDTKRKRATILKTPQDLVVLNMPYEVTEDDMRAYFDKYGELSFVQLKKKSDGSSRGYGFIRYVELEDQKSCLSETHKMGDRELEVKIPQSKAAGFDEVVQFTSGVQRLSRRIHVGNVTSRISRKDLEDYFGQFGPITDVFIPKETQTRKTPMYAFLTFDDEDDARKLVESTRPHLVQGDTLQVAFASPIVKDSGKKTPDAAFNETMDQFVTQAFTGKFAGNEKPRSRTEAVGMATALMKRWIEANGNMYDDRMRGGSDRYRDDYSSAWGGTSNPTNLTGYGGSSFAAEGMYGKYTKW